MTTYALLDSGYQRTISANRLAQKLGATGHKEVLPIQTHTSGTGSAVAKRKLFFLSATSPLNEELVNLSSVLTVDGIPLNAGVVSFTALELEKMEHLKGVVGTVRTV